MLCKDILLDNKSFRMNTQEFFGRLSIPICFFSNPVLFNTHNPHYVHLKSPMVWFVGDHFHLNYDW